MEAVNRVTNGYLTAHRIRDREYRVPLKNGEIGVTLVKIWKCDFMLAEAELYADELRDIADLLDMLNKMKINERTNS